MTLDVPDPSEADALAATSFVRWLLAAGEKGGIGLTKTLDFGDDWRVCLTVDERVTPDKERYPRVLEVRGSPPPQYPPFAAE